jgi:hypothetical protein
MSNTCDDDDDDDCIDNGLLRDVTTDRDAFVYTSDTKSHAVWSLRNLPAICFTHQYANMQCRITELTV